MLNRMIPLVTTTRFKYQFTASGKHSNHEAILFLSQPNHQQKRLVDVLFKSDSLLQPLCLVLGVPPSFFTSALRYLRTHLFLTPACNPMHLQLSKITFFSCSRSQAHTHTHAGSQNEFYVFLLFISRKNLLEAHVCALFIYYIKKRFSFSYTPCTFRPESQLSLCT